MSNIVEDFKVWASGILKGLNLEPSNAPTRIVLVIVAIFFIYSGLNISSSKSVLTKQIEVVEIAFNDKSPEVMKAVVQNCHANLMDPVAVQECIDFEYDQVIKPLKTNLLISKIIQIIWFLSILIFVGGYYLLLQNQRVTSRNIPRSEG